MRPSHLRALLLACGIGLAAPAAVAQATVAPAQDGAALNWLDSLKESPSADGDYWRAYLLPYAIHYHKDEEGTHRYVYGFGAERQLANGWVWGGTYFSNSFGQSSGYFYAGEKVIGWSPWEPLFFQWTAGVLYGYTYPYNDKVPYNYKGFSPGATVSLGWQFNKNFSMQAIALGSAGLIFQFAWDFR